MDRLVVLSIAASVILFACAPRTQPPQTQKRDLPPLPTLPKPRVENPPLLSVRRVVTTTTTNKVLLSWTNAEPVRVWSSTNLFSWTLYASNPVSPLDVTGPAPMFFKADMPQFSSVTLAWDPSSDPRVVGYNLYYGAESQMYTNQIWCLDTGYRITGLPRATTYYFAVTAVIFNGLESLHSGEITWTSLPQMSVPLSISVQ